MHTAQSLVAALSGPLCKGRTIILVTHHISLCLPISSFLVELFQGSVRRFGSIEQLRKSGYLKEVIEREDLVPEAYQPLHESPTISQKSGPTPDNEPDMLAGTPPEGEVTSPVLSQEQSSKVRIRRVPKGDPQKVKEVCIPMHVFPLSGAHRSHEHFTRRLWSGNAWRTRISSPFCVLLSIHSN